MKYVVSVSKTYKHRGLHRHRNSTKKYWHIYYYDEEFRFHSEQVGFLKAMYYKNHLWYKRQFICPDCFSIFVALVKKKVKTAECPNCES